MDPLDARALPLGREASPTTTSSTRAAHCTPFTLPSNGVIEIDADTTITITQDVVFQPQCTGSVDLTQNSISSTLTDLRDPFYASTIPQCYALAATTVIAYTLFIMLLITPRTFLSGGAIVLGRRGFTNGGREAGIGIGGRPWLQKVAALTVAISLTIATVDTFKVAKDQYDIGYMDASALQQEVLNGTELKVMRIISDTFLWLAQAQTLIRLFPRQREKIIIKWTAFALILLDLIFGILDSFVVTQNYTRPRSFNEAIPALSYLFQLALGVLYCAWVIYYSITKRRYAFYHPQMRNICLVALLSIVALFVPIVFFMTDIINHDVAAWGDYVRWVGAAAASVIVWEWVERIEALERNEKKDGVLGREVFDGDEMLEVTPASNSGERKRGNDNGGFGDGKSTGTVTRQWPGMAGIAKYRPRLHNHNQNIKKVEGPSPNGAAPKSATLQLPSWPARPARIATPISRTDTGSAESTVYAVRYHPISVAGLGQPQYERAEPLSNRDDDDMDIEAQRENARDSDDSLEMEKRDVQGSETAVLAPPSSNVRERLAVVMGVIENSNPFARKGKQPPAEITAHAAKMSKVRSASTEQSSNSRWDLIGKFEDFASIQAEKFQSKTTTQETPILPVTRIPAPPRHRTFQEMADLIEEDEDRPESRTFVPEDSHERRMASTHGESTESRLPRSVYTPGSLENQVVTHRGNLSFVTPAVRDGDIATSSRSPGIASTLEAATTVSLSPAAVGSRPLSAHSGGIPVIRIPAPPRPQQRNDTEEE